MENKCLIINSFLLLLRFTTIGLENIKFGELIIERTFERISVFIKEVIGEDGGISQPDRPTMKYVERKRSDKC